MENFELIALGAILLALVWWVGWRAGMRRGANNAAEFPAHYLQGLNYLLNEQPDKAIEVFIKLLEVDSDTIETHFALGSLFRRRGEVDRAIRIHQNLIARPVLDRALRTQALYELGLDYMRAGILSRAESVFLQMVDDEVTGVPSLQQLVDIYQQEREWKKAIEVMAKLEAASGQNKQAIIAHYYCELAELALERGSDGEARAFLHSALAKDPRCVRANLLLAQMEMRAKNFAAAVAAFRGVENQDPDYLPEVIEPLLEAYRYLGTPEVGIDYLRHIHEAYGGVSALLVVIEHVCKSEGEAAAATYLGEQLLKRANVRGLDRLIELNAQLSNEPERARLKKLQEITAQLLRNKPFYRCRQCGFSAKSMHWQCPGCKAWAGLKPTQGMGNE